MKNFLKDFGRPAGTLAAANIFAFGKDWELAVPHGDFPVESYDPNEPAKRERVIQRVDAAAANAMFENYAGLRGKIQRFTVGMPIFRQDAAAGNFHPDHPDGSGKADEIGAITGITPAADRIAFAANYSKSGRALLDSGAVRSWSPHWLLEDTGDKTPQGLRIMRPTVLISGILTNHPNIAGAAANSLGENYLPCPHCQAVFDYAAQPEIAMGTVACPQCKAPVSQTTEAKETKTMSLLEKIAQMLGINVSVGEDGIFSALQNLWNNVLLVLAASESLEDAAGKQESAAANAKLPIAERLTAACNALKARVDAWKAQAADLAAANATLQTRTEELAAANAKQTEVTGQLTVATEQLAAANVKVTELEGAKATQVAAANAETAKLTTLTEQLAAANTASASAIAAGCNLQAEIGTLKSAVAAANARAAVVIVDGAIRAGKVLLADRSGWLNEFAADFAAANSRIEGSRQFLKLRPQAVDLAKRNPGSDANPGQQFRAACNATMDTDGCDWPTAWAKCRETHAALFAAMNNQAQT